MFFVFFFDGLIEDLQFAVPFSLIGDSL